VSIDWGRAAALERRPRMTCFEGRMLKMTRVMALVMEKGNLDALIVGVMTAYEHSRSSPHVLFLFWFMEAAMYVCRCVDVVLPASLS